MRSVLVTIASFLLVGTPVAADRIPMSPEWLEKSARCIIEGAVADVEIFDVRIPDSDFSPEHRRGDLDRHYRYTIRVDSVLKSGGDLEPGEVITVDAWQLLDRKGGPFATITYQGHRPLPAKGERVRAYLTGGARSFKPLDPNGFAPIDKGTLGPPIPIRRSRVRSESGVGIVSPVFAAFAAGILVGGFVVRFRTDRRCETAR